MTVHPYPPEILDPQEEDDGTIVENAHDLAKAVVGHRIVSAVAGEYPAYPDAKEGEWAARYRDKGLELTLDNGKKVRLLDTDDCCAYTELKGFFLDPSSVDHIIMGVGTTDKYTTWHIYADYGDILRLELDWSCGNPFYYGYGFAIQVIDIIDVED